MNDDDVELRADRTLDQYLDVIEWHWEESGRQGMGPRYIHAIEVPRPDGLLTFAFRPTRWNPVVDRFGAWDEAAVVVVFRLIGGTVVRSIPCPIND